MCKSFSFVVLFALLRKWNPGSDWTISSSESLLPFQEHGFIEGNAPPSSWCIDNEPVHLHANMQAWSFGDSVPHKNYSPSSLFLPPLKSQFCCSCLKPWVNKLQPPASSLRMVRENLQSAAMQGLIGRHTACRVLNTARAHRACCCWSFRRDQFSVCCAASMRNGFSSSVQDGKQ